MPDDDTPQRTIRIGINGAAGRMGCRLVALTMASDRLELDAALERPGHELIGEDAGLTAVGQAAEVPITDEPSRPVDVMIDFSLPEGLRRLLPMCVEHRSNLVVGTTGLSDEDHRLLDEAAGSIGVLQAPNMSLGVNLLFSLAAKVAVQLGDDYDIEIVETHHRFKKDAPSGTALGIAEAICRATGRRLEADVVHGRHGEAERRPRQIGMHALRSGDVVGRHTVSFGSLGEELSIGHVATNRDVFVRGALRAAEWLYDKPVGRYTMADVLGLGD